MISDKELRQLMAINKRGEAYCPKGDELLLSALEELLQRREAERNAKSWDGAPDWALSRQRVTETFCYMDVLPGIYQGNARRSYLSREAMGKVEERPK